MLKNTKNSFGSVSKWLHWGILLLLTFMILTGYFSDSLPASLFGPIFNLHKLTGLLILILMLLRVIWWVVNPVPTLPKHVTRYESALAYMVQSLLYVTVLAMPLSGWVITTAKNRSPHLGSWLINLPGIPLDHALGEFFEDVHSTLAVIILVLVGLHTIGAFKHYFIDKDGIFQRMLPRFCHRCLGMTKLQKK